MKTLHCSFCGKSQYEVKKLIYDGKSSAICDVCTAKAHDICQKEEAGDVEYQSWLARLKRLNVKTLEPERA